MPLKYRLNNITHSIELYSVIDPAWESYMGVRLAGQTMYAPLTTNLSHSDASHMRTRRNNTTYAVLFEDTFFIPTGLILPFNSTGTIPTGWTSWTTANNKYLIGAGGAFSSQTTGGSATLTCDTNTTGSHIGSTNFWASVRGAGSFTSSSNVNTSEGNHSHTASVTWNPRYIRFKLIKATADHSKIPENVVILSDDSYTLTQLSTATMAYLFPTTTTGTIVAATTINNSTSNGPHLHYKSARSTQYFTGTYTRIYVSSAGNHSHTGSGSATMTDSLYKALVRAWTDASEEYDLESNMIGMWENLSSIPNGWVLCNGSNGTPDLRDRFITLHSTPSMSGDGELDFSGNYASGTWSHSHWGGTWSSGLASGHPHTATSLTDATHGHTFSGSTNYNGLPWYAIGFIMKS